MINLELRLTSLDIALLFNTLSVCDLLLNVNDFFALLLHLVGTGERETATKATNDDDGEDSDDTNEADTGRSTNCNSNILTNSKHNTVTLFFLLCLLVNKLVNVSIC